MKIKQEATIRECYAPAMEIISQAEADEYFEALVTRHMAFGTSRAEAERVEKINLGYYAGYYDGETRARVERLFHCAHPIFGAIVDNGAPTTEQALTAGVAMGNAKRK